MEFSEEEQVRASVFRCGLLLRPASAEAPRDGGDGGEGKRGSGTDRDEEAGEREEAFYARVRGLSYAQALKNAVRAARSGTIRDQDFESDLGFALALRGTLLAGYGAKAAARARERRQIRTLLRIVVRLPEFAESATLPHRFWVMCKYGD